MATLLAACRTEPPPPPLAAGAAEPEEADAPAGEATEEPAVEQSDRELWFKAGPGRAAIFARERRDHDMAVQLLDQLLKRDNLSDDDRGAAQWLRGLEDLRLERFAGAADRFADARKAPALAVAEVRLVALEAQARLDAGQPAKALELTEAIGAPMRKGSPIADDLLVIEADAKARTNDNLGATKVYRQYLETHPSGARRFEVRAKLARVLAAEDDAADRKAAIELYESLLIESPLSDYGEEASKSLPALRSRSGVKVDSKFARRAELGRVESLLARRRYKTAIQAAEKLLGARGLDPATRCRAQYAKGSAIFKQRQRAKARPTFQRAVKSCAKAGKKQREELVKSLYQAARGYYAEGKFSRAAAAFESLAKTHHDHSYADDAWILAGESWAEQGNQAKAARAYHQALEVEGDMLDEARRRLLVQLFVKGDHKGAIALCDGGLKAKILRPVVRAKLHYFRGRALAASGDAEAARSAWLEAVKADKLGYPSLQALSRLKDHSPEALQEGLAILGGDGAPPPPIGDMVPGPEATRAVLLARLGLGAEAREELTVADVDGWPAVAVLDQAGLYPEGQRMLANMGSKWRVDAPATNEKRWHLAYPRPFLELVVPLEKTHNVPRLLGYAIVQTESRFDPGVTSYAGAQGLAQLMPSTAAGEAKQVGIELVEDSLYDPRTNLNLGLHHLGGLAARFGGGSGGAALATPGYNAGAGAVDKWLVERGSYDLDIFIESIPYDETRKYTQAVLGRWHAYRYLYADRDVPYLPLKTPAKRQ